jgi:3-hydroxybutyryl-CoA dehydratase
MIGVTIEDIRVGDTAQVVRRVDDGDVASFVDAVGDYNPVHADREYAATTMFKEPIAPGIWTAGLISSYRDPAARRAPFISPRISSSSPVLFSDVITARVEVVEVMRARNRIRLKTVCSNQRGKRC